MSISEKPAKILAIDDALSELAREGPVEAEVVKLRFFAGMEYSEIAALLKLSERTVHRYWAFAKVWLYQYLSRDNTEKSHHV